MSKVALQGEMRLATGKLECGEAIRVKVAHLSDLEQGHSHVIGKLKEQMLLEP